MNGAQHCPECGSKMSIKDTAHGGDKTYRIAECPCGERWETTETRSRRLPHMGTGSHKRERVAIGSGQPQPVDTGARPPPPVATGPRGQASGGVGGALPSASDPDSGPISPADPNRARALSGHELCRLFSQVRAAAVGGLPWQSVRVAGGAASDMAAAINEDPGARADVAPTMELLFKLAKAGKAGDKSAEIVKSGSFAFGAWLAKWTELREQLHAKGPAAAHDAGTRGADALVAKYRAAAARAATADELAALRPPKRISVVTVEADGSERPVDLGATG